jgi:hypothetical protein
MSIPSYREMIIKAINALKEQKGSSRVALKSYILSNYKVNYATFHTNFLRALNNLIASEEIEQRKQSYKINTKGKSKNYYPLVG